MIGEKLMNMDEKIWTYSVRTDLALEAREMVSEDKDVEVPGVKVTIEEDKQWDITVTWVDIFNDEGAKIMGKPKGNYITIECPMMKENDIDAHEELIVATTIQLKKLIEVNKDTKVLVVGLGNRHVTPDALGPKVVSSLLVTRHLHDYLPDEINDAVSSVSALAPGVMGQTGVETMEVVEGLVSKIKPDLVICIDALASRRTSRVNTTIQIADTGVQPGAGVGNKRAGINKDTLGVPVIAIGIPTVVDAATVVNDTIEYLVKAIKEQNPKSPLLFDEFQNFNDQEKYMLIKEVLTPYVGELFVTPKDVDAVINRISGIITNSLNLMLHEGLERDDINRFLY